jgi:hypothetical protein
MQIAPIHSSLAIRQESKLFRLFRIFETRHIASVGSSLQRNGTRQSPCSPQYSLSLANISYSHCSSLEEFSQSNIHRPPKQTQ